MNEKEFFNLCGQLVKYMTNKSEAADKRMDMITPFMRVKNSKILKQKIYNYFEKNSCKFFLNGKIFNSTLNSISNFDKVVKFTPEYKEEFIKGVTTQNNILYTKTSEVSEELEENLD